MTERRTKFLEILENVCEEDLDLVEADLSFYDKVSIGFLLYGDEKVNAAFILQKLLIMLKSQDMQTNILRSYSANNSNWKIHLIEALCIIDARRVLRQLGFRWSDIKQHFLPHVPEISLKINPIIKALYVMCEQLEPTEASRLVFDIKEKTAQSNLLFSDFSYLEIFLLDWMTTGVLNVYNTNTPDLRLLIDYFKINEMDHIKSMLDTVLSSQLPSEQSLDDTGDQDDDKIYLEAMNSLDLNEAYSIRTMTAGFVLIINQEVFHSESDPKLKNFLPPKLLDKRRGTNEDKMKLKEVFSSFGYIPVEYDNLTHIEIFKKLREIVKRSVLYDSLIVCILTHGVEGYIYGCNSIPVPITDIEKTIADEGLLGKPKMLIIQACQKAGPKQIIINNPSLPCPSLHSDMVKAMSTLPGHVSFRDSKEGTWFIQSLCKAVHNYGDKKHISDILTIVTRDITNKRGNNNQVMVNRTIQTLTKNFFLPKRLN